MNADELRHAVRERYGQIAERVSSCCGPAPSCCTGEATVKSASIASKIGYADAETSSVLEGADLGLGCGNPIALASLSEGETVVDLGAGAGLDWFLAAARVGGSGQVIGVAPEKAAVFAEAYRVLKPGGRLMISDIVLTRRLPESVSKSLQAYVGCVAGGMLEGEYLKAIDSVGFEAVTVVDKSAIPLDCLASDPALQPVAADCGIPVEDLETAA